MIAIRAGLRQRKFVVFNPVLIGLTAPLNGIGGRGVASAVSLTPSMKKGTRLHAREERGCYYQGESRGNRFAD